MSIESGRERTASEGNHGSNASIGNSVHNNSVFNNSVNNNSIHKSSINSSTNKSNYDEVNNVNSNSSDINNGNSITSKSNRYIPKSKTTPSKAKGSKSTKNRRVNENGDAIEDEEMGEVDQANEAGSPLPKDKPPKSCTFLLFYNIAMIAILSVVIFGIGVYIVSFFYFALKRDSCAWYIKDSGAKNVGAYMPIRHYLLVTGAILIVIFVATLYKSYVLKGLSYKEDEQTIRSAKIPYWLAVLVFDIYLILGSIVFWRHADFAKEICDPITYKYLHDVIIVNYMVAGIINNVFSGIVKGLSKIIYNLTQPIPGEEFNTNQFVTY